MSWPSAALASWARQLEDMIETKQFGEHSTIDCRKRKADGTYLDLLELSVLCEAQEKKETK